MAKDNKLKQKVIFSQKELNRLLLCNQVRELTQHARPVMAGDCFFVHRLLVNLSKSFDQFVSLRINSSIWKRILINPLSPLLIVLLRFSILLSRVIRTMRSGQIRKFVNFRFLAIQGCKEILHTIRAMRRHLYFCKISSQEITGYVLCTDKEEPLIRTCLLLRAMKYYGRCVELLIKRYSSGMLAIEVSYWLSFLLREIGIKTEMYSSDTAKEPFNENVRIKENISFNHPHVSSLSYGIIISTMFDSEIFRSSLTSLLKSDFRGQIVVVEDGGSARKNCEDFCKQLPVIYFKNPNWDGLSIAINRSIQQMNPEPDIVIIAHNDILWPPKWYTQLDRGWQEVYSSGKVDVINLGYLQFSKHYDDMLNELFIRGKYEHLFWVIANMLLIPSLMPYVQEAQNKNMGLFFGLSNDPYTHRIDEFKLRNCKYSVASSFTLRAWKSIDGFDPDMNFGFDLELIHYCLKNRKWMLSISNTPFIHLVSSDTGKLVQNLRAEFKKRIKKTHDLFLKNYGWRPEHFISTYFSGTSIIYEDQIISAANELRFTDIDFIFDDFWKRLENKESCELSWCRERFNCKNNQKKETSI